MRPLLALVLFTLPTAAFAQAATISPGMNRGQVVAALGAPATTRTADSVTYLFYPNRCGRACGMNDLVVLRRDSVVDAIFRDPARHYSGTSSSPAPISRTAARRAPARPRPAPEPAARQPTAAPAQRRPAAANDTRPSIPAGEPPVRPAPATRPPAK